MSVRQFVLDDLKARLATIRLAHGYQTQPLICKSQQEAMDCQETCALWCYMGAETFGEMTLGGGQDAAIEILIYALAKHDQGHLQDLSNALLQDVRNCLSPFAVRTEIAQETGAVFVGYDTCESDEGVFAHDGRMYWVQPVVYKYTSGDSW